MFTVQLMRKERVSVYVIKNVVPVTSVRIKAVNQDVSMLMIHFT